MADPRVEELIATLQAAGWNPGVSQQGASNRILARFTEQVNIKDNGADSTGVLDSTAAWNLSVSQCGPYSTIVLPPGQFTMAGPLAAVPANCTVIGAGEYSTTINTNQASGIFMSLTGANATLTNVLITNTNLTNTCSAISVNANQITVNNVSLTGFGSSNGSISMTNAATFANLFNLFVQSTLAGAVGLVVAGADTAIQGCVFNLLPIGMLCSANDRFAVVDNIYKSCTVGLSLTNTSINGSTTFGGMQFDACVTGVSIAPGNGQVVQAVTFDACVFDNNTTALSIVPTGTGALSYCDLDGCDLISTVSGAVGIVINGSALSVKYITIDGCDIVNSVLGTAFQYTAGGLSTAPISFVNCDLNSTTNVTPAVGSANNLPFVFRACPGVNPVGSIASQPPVVGTGVATTNLTGCDLSVYVVPGASTCAVSIGGVATGVVLASAGVGQGFRVPYAQTYTLTYAAAPTTVAFGD